MFSLTRTLVLLVYKPKGPGPSSATPLVVSGTGGSPPVQPGIRSCRSNGVFLPAAFKWWLSEM